MLTDSEKKWLEERVIDNGDNGIYCRYCDKRPSILTAGLCAGTCPIFPSGHEFRDCAEFEARVAALLAEESAPWSPCYHSGHCPLHVETVSNCMACRLKQARLAVEEELDHER